MSQQQQQRDRFNIAPGRGRDRNNIGSGAMVTLGSSKRTKAGVKLAVPKPVNLPSLKKEHAGTISTALAARGQGWGGEEGDMPDAGDGQASLIEKATWASAEAGPRVPVPSLASRHRPSTFNPYEFPSLGAEARPGPAPGTSAHLGTSGNWDEDERNYHGPGPQGPPQRSQDARESYGEQGYPSRYSGPEPPPHLEHWQREAQPPHWERGRGGHREDLEPRGRAPAGPRDWRRQRGDSPSQPPYGGGPGAGPFRPQGGEERWSRGPAPGPARPRDGSSGGRREEWRDGPGGGYGPRGGAPEPEPPSDLFPPPPPPPPRRSEAGGAGAAGVRDVERDAFNAELQRMVEEMRAGEDCAGTGRRGGAQAAPEAPTDGRGGAWRAPAPAIGGGELGPGGTPFQEAPRSRQQAPGSPDLGAHGDAPGSPQAAFQPPPPPPPPRGPEQAASVGESPVQRAGEGTVVQRTSRPAAPAQQATASAPGNPSTIAAGVIPSAPPALLRRPAQNLPGGAPARPEPRPEAAQGSGARGATRAGRTPAPSPADAADWRAKRSPEPAGERAGAAPGERRREEAAAVTAVPAPAVVAVPAPERPATPVTAQAPERPAAAPRSVQETPERPVAAPSAVQEAPSAGTLVASAPAPAPAQRSGGVVIAPRPPPPASVAQQQQRQGRAGAKDVQSAKAPAKAAPAGPAPGAALVTQAAAPPAATPAAPLAPAAAVGPKPSWRAVLSGIPDAEPEAPGAARGGRKAKEGRKKKERDGRAEARPSEAAPAAAKPGAPATGRAARRQKKGQQDAGEAGGSAGKAAAAGPAPAKAAAKAAREEGRAGRGRGRAAPEPRQQDRAERESGVEAGQPAADGGPALVQGDVPGAEADNDTSPAIAVPLDPSLAMAPPTGGAAVPAPSRASPDAATAARGASFAAAPAPSDASSVPLSAPFGWSSPLADEMARLQLVASAATDEPLDPASLHLLPTLGADLLESGAGGARHAEASAGAAAEGGAVPAGGVPGLGPPARGLAPASHPGPDPFDLHGGSLFASPQAALWRQAGPALVGNEGLMSGFYQGGHAGAGLHGLDPFHGGDGAAAASAEAYLAAGGLPAASLAAPPPRAAPAAQYGAVIAAFGRPGAVPGWIPTGLQPDWSSPLSRPGPAAGPPRRDGGDGGPRETRQHPPPRRAYGGGAGHGAFDPAASLPDDAFGDAAAAAHGHRAAPDPQYARYARVGGPGDAHFPQYHEVQYHVTAQNVPAPALLAYQARYGAPAAPAAAAAQPAAREAARGPAPVPAAAQQHQGRGGPQGPQRGGRGRGGAGRPWQQQQVAGGRGEGGRTSSQPQPKDGSGGTSAGQPREQQEGGEPLPAPAPRQNNGRWRGQRGRGGAAAKAQPAQQAGGE
ncbi:hypothetical protein ACKKBF_B01140 [Auxenochlorella protothecoides x Auxenochlorella symbiontica]